MNESLCSELGQEKPIETRDCGFSRCPVWMIGQWSEVRHTRIHDSHMEEAPTPLYTEARACTHPNAHTSTRKARTPIGMDTVTHTHVDKDLQLDTLSLHTCTHTHTDARTRH